MMQRILLVGLLLFFGVFAHAELQYASITEEDLVAGRFVALPEHLRHAGYFNDEPHDIRGETFEDTIVEGIMACQSSIDVSAHKIPEKNTADLYFTVLNKHPELFYVLTKITYSYDGTYAIAIKPSYITTNQSTIASQQAEIDVARVQALSMIPAGATELEMALILHDYLATHCDYDQTLSRKNTRNIYGALVEKSVVCAGYAVAYEYLLSYAGIPCDYVSSAAMKHAWNMVTLGGQKYHVDVTWDDPTWDDGLVHRNYVAHDNFLRSDNGIKSTGHTSWEGDGNTSSDTKYDGYFWQAAEEQIPCLNGKGYAFDSNELKQYVLSTGVSDKTLLTVSDKWYIWGSSSSCYTDNYSSVVRFGKNLIYSTPTGFRLYDLFDGASKELSSVSCSTSSGYIYGLQHESVNLIAAKIAQSPKDVGNYKDVALYPVTRITLSKNFLGLKTKDVPVTLTATVAPSNASYPELRWSSSKPSVVTVSASGVVSVVGKGTAVITAEAKDNGVKATCEVTVSDSDVAVTGVTLNKKSASLVLGKDTLQLTATIAPADATNKVVTWSSSNSSVARVSSTGLVTPVAKGNAVITVTTADGSFKDTCSVTVAVAVSGVALDKKNAGLVVGRDTLQLNATVSPSNADNKSVSWSSSNPSVATVSSTGLVTPVSKGTAVITVTTADGSYKDTCLVTVGVAVSGVTLDRDSASLILGKETLQLIATVAPADAGNKSVSWSSSNSSVARVSSTGLVTPVAKGAAVITVTTEEGSFQDSCAITVDVAVSGVTLDKKSATVVLGKEPLQLTATVSPSDANNKNVAWSSSNEAVATVSPTGLVTPVSAGSAGITVTTVDGSFQDTCAVTVTIGVTGVSLDKESATILLGKETLQLHATVLPDDATNKDVTWSTSNSAVATVDQNGLVTPVGSGSADIIAQTVDGAFQSSCAVAVVATVTGVKLNKSMAGLKLGKEPLLLTATVVPADAGNKSVSWSSSNEAVASVDQDGLVTAVGVGNAVITVTTEDGGFTAKCSVAVTIELKGIKLDCETATLPQGGETLQLNLSFIPENASAKVLWKSSDVKVATVSSTGLVTSVGIGTGEITATTIDGNYFTAKCVVTVGIPVTGVTLDQNSADLLVGQEPLLLTATVAPEDASNKAVTWSSSDESVATVVDGLVTAVGAGSADITVTTADGSFTATCHTTVVYPPNTLFLKAGWNLVAFRKCPSNLSQFTELDCFVCQDGLYVQTTEFAKHQAYWVRSATDQALIYDCNETRGGDEIVLTSEWQFIGISEEESVGMDRTNLECMKWQDGCFQRVDAQEPLELGRGYLMRKCE